MGDPVQAFMSDVYQEISAAREKHLPFNSDHEAYAVLLEEVEEYWAEVKKRHAQQDRNAMYRELVQIAAMATCAATELIFIKR